mmetsp:Transcript_11142/g.26773  ORF Transcript_11142/g.26773 Transcript_11142/m.26773 type:complete len:521 (+) Transcript_11142:148-1710(+)|eukprot:CAMPEP_0197185462 /NCGR_PEP_ID=MMETSP1423-20130617/11985_1 /TAXON_ID=476441 /ORGANISM="Pseudo-nitzschia heimii, Strain UNC1101" /LENGTH=520 /DNA_ID=CAMNT_0042636531 /DNA_START=65 /DNA_END=1627 /DNA_ORIENTATION=-
MKKDDPNHSIVERLRRCPKLECNFWSRGKFNSHSDGDLSEVTFEEEDFWSTKGSHLVYHAAKKFENNLSDNRNFSGVLSKGSHLRDKAIESHQCCDQSNHVFPDRGIPQIYTKGNADKLSFLSSSSVPGKDINEDRKPGIETQRNGDIPKSEQMCDNKSSFSKLRTDITSVSKLGHNSDDNTLFYEAHGIDELYERMVNTSGLTSSFNTPNNFNVVDSREFPLNRSLAFRRTSRESCQRDTDVDVKNAKSLTLSVDEYPETGFLSLLESLQSNNVIERIVVFRTHSITAESRTRSLEGMYNLFQVIKNLSKSLVELVLWNLHPEDLLNFCLGIYNHQSIGNLHLHMERGTLDQQTLETITTMPSLISLELEVNESFPVWSLLESDSLVLLSVVSTRYEFATDDVLRVAGRIRTNSVLRILDLEPRIPSWCIGAVMASLRFSHTSQLETFRFSCQNNNEDQGDACMAEILKTIDYETSLRVLWNHSREKFAVSKETQREAMLAVKRNPSLKQFHLFKEDEE